MYAFLFSFSFQLGLLQLSLSLFHANFMCSSVDPSVCLPLAEGFISKMQHILRSKVALSSLLFFIVSLLPSVLVQIVSGSHSGELNFQICCRLLYSNNSKQVQVQDLMDYSTRTAASLRKNSKILQLVFCVNQLQFAVHGLLLVIISGHIFQAPTPH